MLQRKEFASTLSQQVYVLETRMRATMYNEKFTNADYLNLFVPAELRMGIVSVKEFATENHWRDSSFTLEMPVGLNTYGVDVTLHSQERLPTPRHPRIQEDADPDLVARVTRLISRQMECRNDFEEVRYAIACLVESGTYPIRTAAYLLPGLRTLATMAGKSGEEILAKMDGTRPKTTPSLDQRLKAAVSVAARTIAVCQLIPDDISMKWDSEVTFSI
jgi:hypothetical protein